MHYNIANNNLASYACYFPSIIARIGSIMKKLAASDSPQANSVTKPPQKLRCPNGYNLFVRDFYKSEGIASYMYMLLYCS